MTWMRASVIVLLIGSFNPVAAHCPGAVGEWVTVGNDGMFETRVAEDLPCRKTADFDSTPFVPGATIDNRILTNADLQAAVAIGQPVEITHCRFTTELDLSGQLQHPIVFRQCEFEGNVTIRDAELRGTEFVECLFHQNMSVVKSVVNEPLIFSNSVLTSQVTIEGSTLTSGLRTTTTRFAKSVTVRDVNTSAGFLFEGSRFVDGLDIIELESAASVRFKDCGFDSMSLVSFDGGNIASGLRFDSCTFANRWRGATDRSPAHVKMADATLGAAMVIGHTEPDMFPTISVSRSVIPFLKIPEWQVVRANLLSGTARLDDVRQVEDAAELLQLIRRGYEADGRRRDAESVGRHYELLLARIRGGPTLWIRTAVAYFGLAVSLIALSMLGVALTLAANANAWKLSTRRVAAWRLIPFATMLTVRALVGAVPEATMTSCAPAGRWLFRVARVMGVAISFLFGIVVNEWVHV